MRYLVISDIHANLEAFDTVMAEAKSIGYEKVLLLGDLVGYGADPNAICERVRDLKADALIRGNHDKVGSGVESPEGFNAVARNAIRWTYETLNKENREWLAALPAGPLIVDDMIEICHGTPFDEDAYVFDDLDALRAMHAARRPLCLFGHTHVQVGHYLSQRSIWPRDRGRSSPARHSAGRCESLPGQSRIGRPAARRRSPRRLRHCRHDGERDDDLSSGVSDFEGAGAHSRGRAA